MDEARYEPVDEAEDEPPRRSPEPGTWHRKSIAVVGPVDAASAGELAPSDTGRRRAAVVDPDEDELDRLRRPTVAEPDERVSQPHQAPVQHLMRLGRAHAGTIGVIMVVALVLAGTRLMSAQGHDVPGGASTPALTPVIQPSQQASPSPTPPTIRVHVLGAVAAAGVVTLPAGARVGEAITAAGGLRADADCAELNLAASIPDGAQIVIGTSAAPRGELRTDQSGSAGAGGLGGASSGGAGGSAPTLNLNTATTQQLESLPGVGPVTAGRIIAWREAHSGFTRIEELQEVDGIGPKTYAKLAPLVHV